MMDILPEKCDMAAAFNAGKSEKTRENERMIYAKLKLFSNIHEQQSEVDSKKEKANTNCKC